MMRENLLGRTCTKDGVNYDIVMVFIANGTPWVTLRHYVTSQLRTAMLDGITLTSGPVTR